MYQVVIERHAMKQLAHVPVSDSIRITEALKKLAVNPRPHGYIKLKGRGGYRFRVGDYRIVYNINDNLLTVFVLLIGNRKNVYE